MGVGLVSRWFCILSVVIGLSPHNNPKSVNAPARLPSYEELGPQQEEERVCTEHNEPLLLRTIQRGVNKGRQYWSCGNNLPCDHFEWYEKRIDIEEAPRVAGDQKQYERSEKQIGEEQINGTISKLLYRSSDGFTVIRLRCSDGSTIGVKANGCLATARVGDEFYLTGKWTRHTRYGRQFEANQAKEKTWSFSGQGFALWLGSGLVPGVGPATAQKLTLALGQRSEEILARIGDARRFGAQDQEAIDFVKKKLAWNQSALNSTQKKISSPAIVFKIADKVAESATERRVIVSLVDDFALPIEAAFALYKAHDRRAAAIFKTDPHGALLAAPQWTFPRVDTLITSLFPLSLNSTFRLAHGLTHLLSVTSTQGHCAQTVETLLETARRDLSTALYVPASDALAQALQNCLKTGQICALDPITGESESKQINNATLLFSPWLDTCEQRIANAVVERLVQFCVPKIDIVVTQTTDTALSKKQRLFVTEALGNGIMILAGGPGTGKTRSARELVHTLYRINPSARIALCAPTARGAAALGAAVGGRASTLHRLLEWRDGEFGRDEQRPLELDLVIVDEVSMLEIPLCAKLLAALSPSTRLVLIGDPDQLPAVGPGALLRDLLLCTAVPRIILKHIFRQQTTSIIQDALVLPGTEAADVARMARAINAGTIPDNFRNCLELQVDTTRNLPDGVVFLDTGDDADAARLAIVETLRRLANHGYDPIAHVQVLAPMKRGNCGVDALNAELQHFVHEQKSMHRIQNNIETTTKTYPLVGDRVIQLVNDYDTGVFNGDVGFVDSVYRNGSFVARFHIGAPKNYARVMYAPADMGTSVSLAYCLTVHKAQGNEYPVVIIPIVHEASYMLTRPLLYTAVSRAKRLLILIGSTKLFHTAVRRASAVGTKPRLTGLVPRMLAKLRRAPSSSLQTRMNPEVHTSNMKSSLKADAAFFNKKRPTPLYFQNRATCTTGAVLSVNNYTTAAGS